MLQTHCCLFFFFFLSFPTHYVALESACQRLAPSSFLASVSTSSGRSFLATSPELNPPKWPYIICIPGPDFFSHGFLACKGGLCLLTVLFILFSDVVQAPGPATQCWCPRRTCSVRSEVFRLQPSCFNK